MPQATSPANTIANKAMYCKQQVDDGDGSA